MSESSAIQNLTGLMAQAAVDEMVEINFAGRALKLDTEKDAQEIVDAIAKCSNLNVLELKGNTLGIEAAGAIGRALENHMTFKRALWSDLFTGRMKTEIPDALKLLCGGIMKAQACLVELDLSDNAFGPNGMKGLVDFLRSSSCYTLQELRLNNNGLGIQGGQMLADSLMHCYEAGVKSGTPLALRVFVSGRGRLEDEGATQLSKVFKAMKSLEEVHMPQNGINHRGITALADAFAFNPTLRHINLSDNTFTVKGSQAMAAAFPHLTKLEIVNFDDCLVRTEGAMALAAAMKSAKHNLKVLKLSGNEINKEGAEEIAMVASAMSLLEELDLNANQLGEEGIESVRGIMKGASKSEQLLSLSDDEGTEDEDDNGDEDSDKCSEEEEETADNDVEGDDDNDDDDDDDDRLNDVMQRISDVTVNSHNIAGDTRSTRDRNEVSNYENQEKSIKELIKLSCGVTENNHNSSADVFAKADEILCEVFSSSGPESVGVVTNCLLVNLGLIKDEDRKYRTLDNMEGALIVLNHAVQQNYFPSLAKQLVATFIDKSAEKLIRCTRIKETLLKTLRN